MNRRIMVLRSYMDKIPEKTQLKVWVPAALHYRLKLKAARDHTTMSDLITKAVDSLLKARKNGEEAKA